MIATEFSPVEKETLIIIGDLLIDRTIYCTVPKISPEAPVPVAMVEPYGIVETPGGAGLAASYATKNNLNIIFLTCADEDKAILLNKHKINSRVIDSIYDVNPRKTRYIDIHSNHHLLRADTDKMLNRSIFGTKNFQNQMMQNFTILLNQMKIGGVIMLDYNKGIFDNEELTQWIIKTAKSKGIPTYVDSRSNDLFKFAGANTLKLNLQEFDRAFNNHNLLNLEIENLVVTLGKDGAEMHCFERDGLVYLEGYSPDLDKYQGTPDVTGCGDVFDVTFCWYWCIKELSAKEALLQAIQDATNFAYKPIKERITC